MAETSTAASDADTSPRPTLHVAIVGSGPSGFYAASSLFKSDLVDARVDMFDRLPTPFGLVRGGVAPDHQKIKNVIRVYDKTAGHQNFRFFGNVHVGRDLPVQELLQRYHAVVLAVGNESDRRLGIDGEDLPGVHSATEFVGWYNGHPDFQDRDFALSEARRVAVVGNGNVAMDVARILARDPDELAGTDITDTALDALRSSAVEEIVILGRRGPAQAAFSPKEIKELAALEDVDLVVSEEEMRPDGGAVDAWLENEAPPSARKNVDFLTEQAGVAPEGDRRRILCRFLVSPTAFAGDGRLESMTIEENELYLDDSGTPRPRGTGRTTSLPVDLVFKAVGYRGVPLDGIPFDERRGVLPNVEGRVIDPESMQPLVGLYVVGWAKRGPSGLIGTNGPDSDATVQRILEDAVERDHLLSRSLAGRTVAETLEERGVDYTTFEDWQRLDREEVRLGEEKGKVREKFCSVPEMMDAIRRLRETG